MCEACWNEAGRPAVDTPLVRAIGRKAKEIDPVGACHIVVDDWNVEDSHIQGCLSRPEATADELEWLRLMMAASVEERLSALAFAYNLWSPPTE